jgi:hypothetical protein
MAGRGGEGGIRTHGKVAPTHAFQACSFNHSDTSPHIAALPLRLDLPSLCGVMIVCREPPNRKSLKQQNISGFLGWLLGLRPGANVVRLPTALHLPVNVFAQLDVFKTAFASHDANRVFS